MEALPLKVVHQLWRVMRNVFTRPWLADAATSLLANVLEYPYTLSIQLIDTVWGELVADVIVCGQARVRQALSCTSGNVRLMWKAAAQRWPAMTKEHWSWRGAIEFAMVLLR